MIQARQDAVGGALSLVLGLCLLVWLIPDWVEPDPDLRLPVNLVPRVIAFGLVVCGTVMLVRSLFAPRGTGEPATGGFVANEFGWFAFMIGVLLVSTLVFEHLHFLVVAPALVAVSMWVFGRLRPISLVLTTILGPVLIWVIATQLLGRVLP